jgi:voltage-gated potassium channel Kch
MAGLTVAQIGEFSLIFMAMGVALGHVDDRAVRLVTIVGLVTIAASVYMITYSHRLYDWLAPALVVFERSTLVRETMDQEAASDSRYDLIVFGLGRYGGAILQLLREEGLRGLGVDFSPAAVRRWQPEGVDVLYGDVGDPELVQSLPVHGTRWVVCAIPEHDLPLAETDLRIALLQALRSMGYRGRIAAAAQRDASVERLRELGVDVVLIPARDAAERAFDMLMDSHRPREAEIIDAEEQKELPG